MNINDIFVTAHARQRMTQRGFSQYLFSLALKLGVRYREGLILDKKSLDAKLEANRWKRNRLLVALEANRCEQRDLLFARDNAGLYVVIGKNQWGYFAKTCFNKNNPTPDF